jgi:hypothetical protein
MKTPVQLGNPQEFGPIEVWPLHAPQQRLTGMSWDLETLNVTEVLDPDPNLLHVLNKGSGPVFVPMGLLIGGLKQTRMVAEDFVIPAGVDREISVLCVEVGRFGAMQDARAAGRAPLSVMTAGHWMTEPCERQEAVWASVRRQEHRSGPRPTHSLEEVMTEDSRSNDTQRLVDEAVNRTFTAADDQIGIVATAGGEPVVMEMFGDPALSRTYTPDLIRAIAFDVDGYEPFPSTSERILEFLNDMSAVKFQCTPKPGGGTQIHGAHGRVQLRGSWIGKRTYVHVMAVNSRHPVLMGV